jgi:chemotaxis signal transduction protein
MAWYTKYVLFLIGNNKYAVSTYVLKHIYRYPSNISPYPGEKKTYLAMAEFTFGAIPIINPEILGISVKSENSYILLFEIANQQFGMGCDTIIGFIDNIEKDVKLLDIKEKI